jgi:signal transduction histidine kinase
VEYQRHFASIVSHELKTPVAALQAQLDEALLYPADVDPRETIRAMSSTTQRFQVIIDDVLVFARIRTAPPVPPEPVDLCALVNEEMETRVRDAPVCIHADGEGRDPR